MADRRKLTDSDIIADEKLLRSLDLDAELAPLVYKENALRVLGLR